MYDSGKGIKVTPSSDNKELDKPTTGNPFNQNPSDSVSNTDEFAIIIAGVSSAFVLTIVVVALYIILNKRCKKTAKFQCELKDFETLAKQGVKSAPNSRGQTPKSTRKFGWPTYGDCIVRSASVSSMQGFILPPAPVQPESDTGSAVLPTKPTGQFQQTPMGIVQPELYGGAEGEEGDVPESRHGRLWFSIVYDAVVEQLTVSLVKLRGLPCRHGKKKPDPFVKVYLLPDEKHNRTSIVRRKTICPVYNDKFVFQVKEDIVSEKMIKFSAYDIDKRRVRHCLGHVVVPLGSMDLSKDDVTWRDLEETSTLLSCGELRVTMNYIPNNERINVCLEKLKHTNHLDTFNNTGIYFKIQLLHNKKISKTKKTETYQTQQLIEINESFKFSVDGKLLDSCHFVISAVEVIGKGPIVQETECGSFTIGSFMFARGAGLRHWHDVVTSANNSVTHWHTFCTRHPWVSSPRRYSIQH